MTVARVSVETREMGQGPTILKERFDRRRTRDAAGLAAGLTADHLEVLETLTERRARLSVFGRPGGESVVVIKIVRFTPKRREPRTEGFRREDLADATNELHARGWLRFAPGFDRDGYFHLTDHAEWVMANR
jgi:hypothetical protein